MGQLEYVRITSSKPSLILGEMGLVNATRTMEGFEQDYLGGTDDNSLEGLVAIDGQDVHFIYRSTGGDPDSANELHN